VKMLWAVLQFLVTNLRTDCVISVVYVTYSQEKRNFVLCQYITSTVVFILFAAFNTLHNSETTKTVSACGVLIAVSPKINFGFHYKWSAY